jgi:hypothetical protein
MTQPNDPSGTVRPEVVQAIFSALIDMDPARLAPLAELGIAPAERKEAEDLYLASMIARSDHLDRKGEVWELLISREWSSPPTWEQLFDELSPERAARLGELYDALPDGARIEYDRRYGRPPDE